MRTAFSFITSYSGSQRQCPVLAVGRSPSFFGGGWHKRTLSVSLEGRPPPPQVLQLQSRNAESPVHRIVLFHICFQLPHIYCLCNLQNNVTYFLFCFFRKNNEIRISYLSKNKTLAALYFLCGCGIPSKAGSLFVFLLLTSWGNHLQNSQVNLKKKKSPNLTSVPQKQTMFADVTCHNQL